MLKPSEILYGQNTIAKLLQECNLTVSSKHGLTEYESSILLYLYNHPHKNTATDIVDYRKLPKANVSKAVESLICKNLLIRNPDPRDRRRIHLALTEEALAIIPDLIKAMNAFFDILLSDFDKKERALYASLNRRIIANAEKGLLQNEDRNK